MFSARPPHRSRLGLPRWEVALLGVWFAVFAVLAEYFPRSGDDWAWGSQEGLNRLPRFFAGLNGRYAGDLLALVLVRSGPVAALVVSATVCATLFLVLHLAQNRTPFGYGLAGVLFLTMPLGTWREGVVWLSGFVNYAFAAIVFLGFLALAQAEWNRRLARPGHIRLALVAVAGFVGQLFMEHVTVCICLIGVGLALLYRRTHGAWGAYIVTWTVAAFAGAGVMFSNAAYRHAATGGAYQSVQSTSGKHALRDLVVKLFDYLSTHAVVSNLVLNGVLVVLLGLLVATSGQLRTVAGRAIVGMSAGYLVLVCSLWLAERHGGVAVHTRELAIVAALLLLAILILSSVTLVRSRQRRWTVFASCAAVALMIGPLLFVNPVGARCFYPTYLLLMVVVSVYGAEVRERVPALERGALSVPLHLVSGVLIAVMFVVYVTVNNAIDRRLDHVREAVATGQSVVHISPLPYPYFVHNGDPFWSLLGTRFKAYYGFPRSLVVKLSPNPWLRVPGKPPPLPAP